MKYWLLCAVLVASVVCAQKLYQQGTVVSVGSVGTTHVYTAKMSGYDGQLHDRTLSTNGSRSVYRIEADSMYYEVSGHKLEIGSTVQFRLEKDHLYIQDGSKEQKYSVEGKGLKK